MPKKIRHACRYLAGNEKIAVCLELIERSARLLGEARSALPPPLDEHCLHAVLDAGVLTLTTHSPVWSSRLRFFAPQLVQTLAPRFGPITSCRVRVQPPAAAPRLGTTPRYKLSARTEQHLVDAAAGIEDAELAITLRRLAKAGSARG